MIVGEFFFSPASARPISDDQPVFSVMTLRFGDTPNVRLHAGSCVEPHVIGFAIDALYITIELPQEPSLLYYLAVQPFI